ncbi:hypothetical protein [Thermosulfuriphilus ammonigenes]|uniref:hypothetical protein n=1 Tax=Thermosulfuriphilus ammonigenes TaxID=1936021 RepID=UPI001C680093|nr:hypothetical protein [Thermosulfuriphilus ammonigenes]
MRNHERTKTEYEKVRAVLEENRGAGKDHPLHDAVGYIAVTGKQSIPRRDCLLPAKKDLLAKLAQKF